MWCLSPCLVQGLVDIKNAILVDYAWIEKIRKKDVLSLFETEMPYAVLARSSPCVPTAIKIKAWMGFAIGRISNGGFLCSHVKPRPSISKQGWLRVPVVYPSCVNFSKPWGLNINCW